MKVESTDSEVAGHLLLLYRSFQSPFTTHGLQRETKPAKKVTENGSPFYVCVVDLNNALEPATPSCSE